MLEESGGQIVPLQDVPADDIAAMYELLFEKRWGFAVPGKHYLARVFSALRPFMVGHLIRIDGQPAAIQIVYRVEAGLAERGVHQWRRRSGLQRTWSGQRADVRQYAERLGRSAGAGQGPALFVWPGRP